jgi:hypothetical protein
MLVIYLNDGEVASSKDEAIRSRPSTGRVQRGEREKKKRKNKRKIGGKEKKNMGQHGQASQPRRAQTTQRTAKTR